LSGGHPLPRTVLNSLSTGSELPEVYRTYDLASAPRSVISTDANEAVHTHGRPGTRGHG